MCHKTGMRPSILRRGHPISGKLPVAETVFSSKLDRSSTETGHGKALKHPDFIAESTLNRSRME